MAVSFRRHLIYLIVPTSVWISLGRATGDKANYFSIINQQSMSFILYTPRWKQVPFNSRDLFLRKRAQNWSFNLSLLDYLKPVLLGYSWTVQPSLPTSWERLQPLCSVVHGWLFGVRVLIHICVTQKPQVAPVIDVGISRISFSAHLELGKQQDSSHLTSPAFFGSNSITKGSQNSMKGRVGKGWLTVSVLTLLFLPICPLFFPWSGYKRFSDLPPLTWNGLNAYSWPLSMFISVFLY